MLRKRYCEVLKKIITMMNNGLQKFKIVVPVWGETYLRTFLRYSLPSQMNQKNLIHLIETHNIDYVVYTRAADMKVLVKNHLVKKMLSLKILRIELIDEFEQEFNQNSNYRYDLKSRIYALELRESAIESTPTYCLNADIFFSNNFFNETIKLIEGGAKAVQVFAPRTDLDAVRHIFEPMIETSSSIEISATDLSKIWAANIHPLNEMHFVENLENKDFHPSTLIWRIKEDSYYIKSFHLYPILVKPEKHNLTLSGTIDGTLLEDLNLSRNQIFTVTNLDSIFCCELSTLDHYVGRISSRDNLSAIRDFYLKDSLINLGNLSYEFLVNEKDPSAISSSRVKSLDFITSVFFADYPIGLSSSSSKRSRLLVLSYSVFKLTRIRLVAVRKLLRSIFRIGR
jgi:hypothetical protein